MGHCARLQECGGPCCKLHASHKVLVLAHPVVGVRAGASVARHTRTPARETMLCLLGVSA